MRGDILILKEEHRRAASQLASILTGQISRSTGKFFITIAGESGAGKSEMAAALKEELELSGIPCLVMQQDDFFVYPPKTNASVRVRTDGDVGPHEVKLDLINDIIKQVKNRSRFIIKPLVIFPEDRIITETIDTGAFRVLIIEGTYTTLLDGVDCRIFIDRNLHDTRTDRQTRNRETQDSFLEKILLREHEIISGHSIKADLIISREFNVISVHQP
jgi:uridine kinase